MSILKNSLRNICRSPGRSILIGIIVLIITVSSCIGLSIMQAAKAAQEEGLKGIVVSATISVDRQAIMQSAQSSGGGFGGVFARFQNIGLDEMMKYASSSYVKDFYYTTTSSVSKSEGLEPIDTTSSSVVEGSQGNNQLSNLAGALSGRLSALEMSVGPMGRQGDFTLIGYSSESLMEGFVNGTNKITYGSVFAFSTADNTCLISDQVALLNDIKVGDRITILNPNLDTETFELNVVGLYSITETNEDASMLRFSTANDPANQILVSYQTLKSIMDSSTAAAQTIVDDRGNTSTTALRGSTSGQYIFKNVADFEAFKEDVRTMGLSSDYAVVSSDVESYRQGLIPLENLKSFALTFLIIILVIGAIILIVINVFNIRERKYEVGVLTAIGMKKSRVATQFIVEIFIITLVSMLIGTAIGAAASLPTANFLLENQVEAQQSQSVNTESNFGRLQNDVAVQGGFRGRISTGMLSNIEYLSSVESAMNLSVLLQIMVIGILLTLVSSSAAVVFVLRYEPLKILSERS